MRLLNTKSRKLSYFNEHEVPPYVILSHTWGSEEVTFQDISGSEPFQDLKGNQKIDSCCRQAVANGYEYVWIDTCCIDKTSSAELSEAINSMFEWYRKSDVCYAFLCDINVQGITSGESQLGDSKWFTRGWTLQELIAPWEVVFYDSQWMEIGTRLSLCSELSDITGIDARLLRNDLHVERGIDFEKYSVACRMSWASKRVTTRIEDMAYCLMGIFGVNMPLLYGEGEKAFQRLQEEIMKTSDDHSLFAWTAPPRSFSGLLAPSPREFAESRYVELIPAVSTSPPFSMTNKGVQITLPILKDAAVLFPLLEFSSPSPTRRPLRTFQADGPINSENLWTTFVVALLNCQLSDAPGQCLALLLHESGGFQMHIRYHFDGHIISPLDFLISENTKPETIFIEASTSVSRDLAPLSNEHWCTIRSLPADYQLGETYPKDRWSHNGSDLRLTMPLRHRKRSAVLLFQEDDNDGYAFAVVFQLRKRSFDIAVISDLENENRSQIIQRCREPLEPQDRVTHKLDGNREVCAYVRKCPGGHVADISTRLIMSGSKATSG